MEAFKLLEKHAKHFVGEDKDGKRKAITGIMHSPEGIAYVTDATKVLRVEGVSEGKEGKVLSLTGKDLEVEPLNMERLLPDRDLMLALDVRTQDLYDALNAFQAITKVTDDSSHCTLEATNEGLILSFKATSYEDGTSVTGSWKIDGSVVRPFKKSFAIKLLFDCVKALKDTDTFIRFIGQDSGFHPLMLSAGEVETLALPIRVY